ncbi:type II secretion system F family protein [bacterium]|nr:type II secretion system F family protein [bacterium]
MSYFTYVARDRDGKRVQGEMEAADRRAAISKLRESGLMVATISEKRKPLALGKGFATGGLLAKKVSLKDLAVFSKQFSAMIDSGIDVLRCLKILSRQTENPAFQGIISKIHDDVSEGQTLAGAMSKHSAAFPRLYISLIRASEESGALDTVLSRLAESLESELSLRNQVAAGMKYPQAIGVAALIILTVIMIFVIPTFAEMFKSMGGKLPLMTRALIAAATFMKSYWWAILLIYFGLPTSLKLINNTTGGRLALDRLKLRMPVFGQLTQKVIVARFTRNLATMLGNGIPILRALEIVDEAAGNVVYETAIRRIRESVKEGESIAGPMEASRLFPPMVPAMIAVGEESGDLDGMLTKVADFYDAEIDSTVKVLTSLLEPILISVMGAVVGFIVISLFLPLFEMIKLVQKMT